MYRSGLFQVYLVDYGRSLFVSRSQCFAMPKCIAHYAPPLAHYCTLNDVDSRSLDHAAVKAFHERIVTASEVMLRCMLFYYYASWKTPQITCP
ncbi:unnamed protein product [Nippostrongylus brasiliensis]|uniref:Tudor domain-containing protein n=1 Tax=Nippostrongylus brasiliensis TaxID=27835 RepID=A0A0N4XPG4_NIPBR|nr:unnamed protein product [Nippostrongylus brasiliensis]